MRTLIIASLLVFGPLALAGDDGEPFGPVGETEYQRLVEHAKAQGCDLDREGKQAYSGDEAAWKRIFALSLTFDRLDGNARAYGQVVYSGLLNLGEVIGVEGYVKLIDQQPPEVQQRIRDFLWYALIEGSEQPELQREQIRQEYPTLFPTGYKFAHNDPIFAPPVTR